MWWVRSPIDATARLMPCSVQHVNGKRYAASAHWQDRVQAIIIIHMCTLIWPISASPISYVILLSPRLHHYNYYSCRLNQLYARQCLLTKLKHECCRCECMPLPWLPSTRKELGKFAYTLRLSIWEPCSTFEQLKALEDAYREPAEKRPWPMRIFYKWNKKSPLRLAERIRRFSITAHFSLQLSISGWNDKWAASHHLTSFDMHVTGKNWMCKQYICQMAIKLVIAHRRLAWPAHNFHY